MEEEKDGEEPTPQPHEPQNEQSQAGEEPSLLEGSFEADLNGLEPTTQTLSINSNPKVEFILPEATSSTVTQPKKIR